MIQIHIKDNKIEIMMVKSKIMISDFFIAIKSALIFFAADLFRCRSSEEHLFMKSFASSGIVFVEDWGNEQNVFTYSFCMVGAKEL